MEKSLYQEIMSWKNICGAYFDLYTVFTEKNKGFSYSATTGGKLYDLEPDIEDILIEAQTELFELTPLMPAKYVQIPKKSGGMRGIYMLTVKDRIKCQAIYRVLEKYFENIYTPYLYSFRSSHPSYYALRSVKRFYFRNFNKKMYVAKMDFTNYSDYHNHKYLIEVLKKHGIEDNVIEQIKLFIRQPYVNKGAICSRSVGTMQGMNLCPLFNNIYAHHIDEHIGENVEFYRRVGDDFIMFDKDPEKIKEMIKYVETEADKSGLVINRDKTIFGEMQKTTYTFLGLEFDNGKTRVPQKSVSRLMVKFKKVLSYSKNMPLFAKLRKFKAVLQNDKFLDQKDDKENFMHYVRSYNLVSDRSQINQISKKFFTVFSRFFTGGTTYKKLNETKEILKKNPFPSFSKLHYLYTNGRHP